jgi:hypothetical protein
MLGKFYSISITAVALLMQAAQVWACAVCLGDASDSTIDGYNASVLFLMSTPYLVVGSIVAGLIFTYRRARKRHEETDAEMIGHLEWNQEESSR